MEKFKERPVTRYEFELMLYTGFKVGNNITARKRLKEDIDPILVRKYDNDFSYDIIDDEKKCETICFHVRFNASEDNGEEVGDEIKDKCDIVIRHSAESL